MKALPVPTISAITVFNGCVDAMRDGEKKTRLKTVAPIVSAAEDQYAGLGKRSLLHTIASETNVGNVSKTEMEDLYNNKLVAQKSPARHFYDSLQRAVKYNRCPLCSHRSVSTLDHYLPKSDFPVFAVTPTNLIPSCRDCNACKGTTCSANGDEQFVHPFFDDPDCDVWLVATVIEGADPAITFNAKPVGKFSAVLAKRISYHFEKLSLGSLYCAQAAGEVVAIRHHLGTLFASGGKPAVTDHLSEQYKSRAILGKNMWQTALYSALAKNGWFCSGGFQAFS